MKKPNATELLKEKIKEKEFEKLALRALLKEDIHGVYENLKPINVLKNTMKNVAGNKDVKDMVIDTSLGLTAGYLSKKLVAGSSKNLLRKLAGSALQFGISTLIMKNPGILRSLGGILIEKIFSKRKEEVTEHAA